MQNVDDVNNFGAGIILAVFMPLFGADETFKNPPDDVVFKL
jgi:hypothetical protein